MTHYKRAYSKYKFCGMWSLFANPVTKIMPKSKRFVSCRGITKLCMQYLYDATYME